MSAQSHKSEYTILAVLAIVSALVLLVLVQQGLVRDDRSGRSGVRTTRSTNVDGLLACYELFKRLEIPVERSHGMLLSGRIAEADVIFLIDPWLPLNTGEVVDLSAWIEQGGVLVAAGNASLYEDFDPALRHLIDRTNTAAEDWTASDELPLARDVSAASFESNSIFALRLADADKPQEEVQPLFEDRHGVRIVEHTLGEGRLILLSDSSFLANDRLGEQDNSVLAVNLAAYATARANGRGIVFDEYHFGAGRGAQGFGLLGGMLLTTSAGWAVLTLTAAGILYLYYKGRQFGPRRDLARQRRRRSKMEYVYAVGATYRSAGAHKLTLRLIYNWFRQRAAGRAGLAPNTANQLLAQELARRAGDPNRGQDALATAADEIRRVLDDCDGLLARSGVSQHQLTAALSRLAQIEKEALDGLGNGKRTRP